MATLSQIVDHLLKCESFPNVNLDMNEMLKKGLDYVTNLSKANKMYFPLAEDAPENKYQKFKAVK